MKKLQLSHFRPFMKGCNVVHFTLSSNGSNEKFIGVTGKNSIKPTIVNPKTKDARIQSITIKFESIIRYTDWVDAANPSRPAATQPVAGSKKYDYEMTMDSPEVVQTSPCLSLSNRVETIEFTHANNLHILALKIVGEYAPS